MSKNRRDKAIVIFNESIEIKGEIIPAARCKIEGISEELFFIPAKGTSIPDKSEPYLVLLPSFYYDEKSIYSVKIIKSERVGEIKIFNNIFISGDLFKSINGNKVAVIIMDPGGEHKTLLLRIAINNDNRKIVGRFIVKNLLLEHTQVRVKNGIIEIILEPLEDFNYLRNEFLKHLSGELSET